MFKPVVCALLKIGGSKYMRLTLPSQVETSVVDRNALPNRVERMILKSKIGAQHAGSHRLEPESPGEECISLEGRVALHTRCAPGR